MQKHNPNDARDLKKTRTWGYKQLIVEDNLETMNTGSVQEAKSKRSGKAEMLDYLHFIRGYFLIAALLFFAAVAAGYVSSALNPEIARILMQEFEAKFGSIRNLSPLFVLLAIFLNNSFISLLALVLGMGLGILPVILVISNGYVVGVISYSVGQEKGMLYVLLALLPHGIIELPMVFLASGIGLRLGHQVISAILGRPTDLKYEFMRGLSFYFHWIVPLLFVAALIETFITPLILYFI